MQFNKWTVGLAAAGLVSLPWAAVGEEALNPVNTALSSTTISGYVSTSAHWDFGTGNDNPPAYLYNQGKQDGFNLNVVKLSLERPLDQSQWAAGYKVDLLFGPDANMLATQSSGVQGDFAVEQAYVALQAPVGNGLMFKTGVFDSIIGYEVFDAGSNPNYTRSYGYTIEPSTHTGVLMTYQFNDQISASAGVANTLVPTINARAGVDGNSRAESFKSYIGSLALVAPDGWGFLAGSTLYGGVLNGFNGTDAASFNQTSVYSGASVNTPVDGLTVGMAFDYLMVHTGDSYVVYPPPAPDVLDGSPSYAYAASLYSSYQATEKLSLHVRGEYFKRSPASGSTLPDSSFVPGWPPSRAVAVTGTVQYDLWKNVISRVEFRWDHAADGDDHFNGTSGTTGFGGPTRQNAYLLAANVIYKF